MLIRLISCFADSVLLNCILVGIIAIEIYSIEDRLRILSFHAKKLSICIQWNLLITATQETGENGRYVQVTAIYR